MHENIIYDGTYSFLNEEAQDIFDSVKVGLQNSVSLYVWHDLSERDLVNLDDFIDQVFNNILSNSFDIGSDNQIRIRKITKPSKPSKKMSN